MLIHHVLNLMHYINLNEWTYIYFFKNNIDLIYTATSQLIMFLVDCHFFFSFKRAQAALNIYIYIEKDKENKKKKGSRPSPFQHQDNLKLGKSSLFVKKSALPVVGTSFHQVRVCKLKPKLTNLSAQWLPSWKIYDINKFMFDIITTQFNLWFLNSCLSLILMKYILIGLYYKLKPLKEKTTN